MDYERLGALVSKGNRMTAKRTRDVLAPELWVPRVVRLASSDSKASTGDRF